MRQRVQDAIAELDYRPSIAARSMRGSSLTIGLAIPVFATEFFAEIYAGIESVLDNTPYRVLTIVSGLNESREFSPTVQALIDRQVDALIIIAPLVSSSWLSEIARTLPLVVIGRHDSAEHYDSVVGDDAAGARLVVEHLVERGHRRIVHVSQFEDGEQVPGTPHSIRREAFLAAMSEHGLRASAEIIGAAYQYDPALSATAKYLSSSGEATAIFAGADDAALGVLAAAAEYGRDDQTAVVGYDNSRLSAHPRLALTSVDHSGVSQGRLAAELVLSRIKGRTTARHEHLPVKLVTRSSSTKPVDTSSGS